MDGVGHAFDNIMVERLWRTVKYEDVYLRDDQTPAEAHLKLARYFVYYNHQRRHRSLGRRTPASVYGLPVTEFDQPYLVRRKKSDILEPSGGCSAAGTSPIEAVPPYFATRTVQRMGQAEASGIPGQCSCLLPRRLLLPGACERSVQECVFLFLYGHR